MVLISYVGLPPIHLLTPQLNLYTNTSDHFPFNQTHHPASASGSTSFPHPHSHQSNGHQPFSASALPSHTDFFSMLSQTPHQSQSQIPSSTSTPAPTPFLGGNGFTMNTGALGGYDRSQLATPMGSPGLSFGHGHTHGHGTESHSHSQSRDRADPTPPSTGHSANGNANGDQAGTPGGEADGEDKRVRNTMACEFILAIRYTLTPPFLSLLSLSGFSIRIIYSTPVLM